MKVKILVQNAKNINPLFVKICDKLEEGFVVFKDDVDEIRFNKKHYYQSHNWEIHLYKLKILNSGKIVLEKKGERVYLIGDINITVSFVFTLLFLLLILTLLTMRLNLNLVIVPILFLPLYGIMYLIYFLKIKSFLKILTK